MNDGNREQSSESLKDYQEVAVCLQYWTGCGGGSERLGVRFPPRFFFHTMSHLHWCVAWHCYQVSRLNDNYSIVNNNHIIPNAPLALTNVLKIEYIDNFYDCK